MANVLFVSHSLMMSGGANQSMIQLILELRENHNINPFVLAPLGKTYNDKGLINICNENNIPVIRSIIPWMIHSKVWLHRLKYLFLFLLYPFLVLKLRSYRFDIIHSNGSVIDLGARLSKSLHIPHIWHLREFGYEDSSLKPVWGNNYILKQYKCNDTFIAISDVIKNYYETTYNLLNVNRIYNGISLNKYSRLSSHDNKLTEFVIVGMVTEHKNQFEAVRAVENLISQGVLTFHLSIIGQDDSDYANSLKMYVSSKQLGRYITFYGIRSDVPELLSNMDVGLMLSKAEAFGRVTVEYMFQKLVVIASNTGANPELIEDGVNGYLYQFGDYLELANKMKCFIQNNILIKQMSDAGRCFAVKHFSSLINSNSVYELYKSVL